MWLSARGFLESLRSEFQPGNERSDVMGAMVRVPVLLLDDLGAGDLTGERGDWRRDRIAHVLCERYDMARPTIVTTNLSPDELYKTDARLASRLLSGVVVEIGGPDHRLQAASAAGR